MRLNLNANKKHFPSGLYGLALERLNELDGSSSGVIRFPRAFEKLGSTFSINKQQCWELLFVFRDLGFIEIAPGNGIKILNGGRMR